MPVTVRMVEVMKLTFDVRVMLMVLRAPGYDNRWPVLLSVNMGSVMLRMVPSISLD